NCPPPCTAATCVPCDVANCNAISCTANCILVNCLTNCSAPNCTTSCFEPNCISNCSANICVSTCTQPVCNQACSHPLCTSTCIPQNPPPVPVKKNHGGVGVRGVGFTACAAVAGQYETIIQITWNEPLVIPFLTGNSTPSIALSTRQLVFCQ
ncbi:MAG: hypothetical protein ABR598_00165, partial [Candidatus Dormibacteria bacterium]